MIAIIKLATKIWLWIRKDGAALFGLINSVIRIIRELIITVIRILGIILPDSFVEETIIAKISRVFDNIEEKVKKATDWLLGMID